MFRCSCNLFVIHFSANVSLVLFMLYLQWKDLPPDQLMESKLKCVFEHEETTETQVRLHFLEYMVINFNSLLCAEM